MKKYFKKLMRVYKIYLSAQEIAEKWNGDDDDFQEEAKCLNRFIVAVTRYMRQFPEKCTVIYYYSRSRENYDCIFSLAITGRCFCRTFDISYYNMMVRVTSETWNNFWETAEICRCREVQGILRDYE